ncbi:uncharacterized protein LOC119663960, partial [Teleopsis dalmanni]|uniref:uncharacterized protein LOC119663960 n=1 Tax=Teleopsis dalmanni TaxID=139649 RepID=UPI0018CD4793
MSDSDRKKDLVTIHGLIKEKKLTEAIEKCNIYLKEHPNSYQCHMLIGAAYTNNNNKIEAAKHLRDALELCKGSPISVLRGLIGCVSTEELPDVYKQLLPLESEDKYYCESIERISIHSQNPQVFLDFFELMKQQAETNINDNRKNVVMKSLCGMCVSGVRISDVDDQSLKSTFELLIEYYKDQEKHSEIHVHKLYLRTYKKYIKLLYKLQDYKNCLKHASLIVQQNAEDEYAYEWICKIYSEYYKDDVFKDWQNELEYPVEHYSEKLVQLNEKSSLGLLVKSIIFYNQQQYVPCRDLLNKVRTLVPDNIVAIDLLAITNMVLGAFEIAMNLWHDIHNDKMYAICASHTADRELNKSAIKLLQTLEQSIDVVEALARCYFSLKDFDALKRLKLSDIAKTEYLLEPVEAIELIEHSEDSDSFSRFFLLGKLYFKISNYSSSLTWTLKATRIQSYRAECFLYL